MTRKSIATQLSKRLGGTWYFDRSAFLWRNHEDNRWARRVHTGGVDEFGNVLPGSDLFLYPEGMRLYIQEQEFLPDISDEDS